MSDNFFINIKNFKLKFIQKDPYCIFRIENFYTDDGYKKLLNNFPKINEKNEKEIISYNNKYYFNSDSHFYKKLRRENEVISNFHNNIFNESLIEYFYTKFYNLFLKARKKDFPIFLRLLKLPYFNVNNLQKETIKKIFLNSVRPIVEFSYIMNNGKVVPHTDNRNKLLSMLTYFPDEIYDDEKNIELGTKFWISNTKNYENTHYKDDLETAFINNNKIVYNTPFDKKNLYGFIKNEYSWHSVSQINIPDKKFRKSINISLMID